MEPYVWFDRPLDLQSVLRDELAQPFRPFTIVVGHTHFGDLFLKNLESGELAVTTQGTCTLFDSGYFEESEFPAEYLQSVGIVEHLLRPYYIWTIETNWPAGEISFGASGFSQVLRSDPILTGEQQLSTHEREDLIDREMR